jgi:hypothetical protein
MGPIQVKDGVRSNSDCIEHDKVGIVTAIKVIKTEQLKKQFTYYVRWESFNYSLPHSRKSLSRDDTIRNYAKTELYKKVEAKERAKMEFPDGDYSSDEEIRSREYKPTNRDYYHEKKEKTRIIVLTEAEKEAAEEKELEARLKANLVVDKTEYKTPDIKIVTFANYPQHKHKVASDYSNGPCYIFLPYKIVT